MSNIEAPDWTGGGNVNKPMNHYKPYDSEINDNTIMEFGKYKGYKMANVPDWWLYWYYTEAEGVKNYYLMLYIKTNIDTIKNNAARKQTRH